MPTYKTTRVYYGWVSENERLISKANAKRNGCWEWTGAINSNGYAVFRTSGRQNKYAHRLMWELANGKKIKEGLEIDHICRNTRCVRPSHLEPVVQVVNMLRGNSPASKNAKKKVCIRGHPFSKKNTYVRPDGHGRMCLQCCSFRAKRYGIRAGVR